MTSITKAALAIISCFLSTENVYGNFTFDKWIGATFLSNKDTEASGIDIAPNGDHLVVASDNGKIIFLNLDSDKNHCLVDLSSDTNIAGRDDFEGVAFDPTIWEADDMHAYVVHEGTSSDEPILFKINYTYDATGTTQPPCTASVVEATSLKGAIDCLDTGNGIEGLGLKMPSDGSSPAVFVVSVQDTGKSYLVDSNGQAVGSECYDGAFDDVSSSFYDSTSTNDYMWFSYGSKNKVAVFKPNLQCSLDIFDIPLEKSSLQLDTEGMVFDFINERLYVASDNTGGSDPSSVAVYKFTSADLLGGLGTCMACGNGTCDPDENCLSCPMDCDARTGGPKRDRFCCGGDNTCVGKGCSNLATDYCLDATPPSCTETFAVCGGTSPPGPGEPCDCTEQTSRSECSGCDGCKWVRNRECRSA